MTIESFSKKVSKMRQNSGLTESQKSAKPMSLLRRDIREVLIVGCKLLICIMQDLQVI